MAVIRRSDRSSLQGGNRRPRSCNRWLRALLFIVVFSPFTLTHAQAPGARQAIESLENCSQQERRNNCVKILQRKPVGKNIQAIKAQVRGGRIIWYEYNVKSGSIKRTN